MLKPNDKIALILGCPAIDKMLAEQAQLYCKNELNLNAIYGLETTQYLPPKERADIFLSYLCDTDIKAICAIRGGEGSADLIPYLDQHREKIMSLTPKPIVGFSDITALLLYFSQIYRWPTTHGPGISQLMNDEIDALSQQSLKNYLFTEKYTSLALTPLNDLAQKEQTIEAELTGGNLSLINISIKDTWEIDCDGKIIFLEDVGEKPHVVYRILKYLQRIKKFDHAKAIILGDFVDRQQRDAFEKIFQYFAALISIPVFQTEQFGHGKTNRVLPYCKPAILSSSPEQTSLRFHQ